MSIRFESRESRLSESCKLFKGVIEFFNQFGVNFIV